MLIPGCPKQPGLRKKCRGKGERSMKSTGMRKIVEILMAAVMVWSAFQIRNCAVIQRTTPFQGEFHWDILTYELLFLAAGFGLVAAIEKGIFKKHYNNEEK